MNNLHQKLIKKSAWYRSWYHPAHGMTHWVIFAVLSFFITSAILSALPKVSAVAGVWYVSPTGSASAAGSITSPWDINTAFSGAGGRILPGDTVYLRGGTYAPSTAGGEGCVFCVTVAGTASAPVKIVAYPGERVTLDGGLLSPSPAGATAPINIHTLGISGAYVWVMGVEITSTATETRLDPAPLDGRGPRGLARARGVGITGTGAKLINSLIHNTVSSGIGVSGTRGLGMEIYGTLIWDNGWWNTKGNGHGMYLDGNDLGTPRKLVRSNYVGMNFGDFGFQVVGGPNHFDFDRNIILKRNLIGSNCSDITITNNYFANNAPWSQGSPSCITRTGNIGIDNTTGNAQAPTTNQVFVEPNIYDANRVHVVVYNPSSLSNVNVDVSSLGWASGSTYELRSVLNYYGDVVTGTLSGSNININMNASAHSVTTPLGWSSPLVSNLFPGFGAFVLIKTSGGSTPPPPPPPPPPPDTTPPNAIADLRTTNILTTSADLSWTAPADPPTNSSVVSYDIRYFTSPITLANWNSAFQATGEPAPGAAGSTGTYILVGLNSATGYYVAIRSTDASGNISNLSNILSFTTQTVVTPPTPPPPPPTPTPSPPPTPSGGGGGKGTPQPSTQQTTVVKSSPLSLRLIKYQGNPTVYVLRNGIKQGIPSYAIYQRHFAARPIATIPDSEVYPDGAVLRFTSGALIRGSSPTVYLVLDDNALYPFKDASEFFHFGYKFSLIHQISDQELSLYPISPISSLFYHASTNLVKYASDPTVYMIENNTKRPLTSPDVYFSYATSWDEVLTIPDSLTYQIGNLLVFPDGLLLKGSGPGVYLVSSGELRPFLSAEIFFKSGYSFSQVREVRDSDLTLNVVGEKVE